jgi:hypothetical protein
VQKPVNELPILEQALTYLNLAREWSLSNRTEALLILVVFLLIINYFKMSSIQSHLYRIEDQFNK